MVVSSTALTVVRDSLSPPSEPNRTEPSPDLSLGPQCQAAGITLTPEGCPVAMTPVIEYTNGIVFELCKYTKACGQSYDRVVQHMSTMCVDHGGQMLPAQTLRARVQRVVQKCKKKRGRTLELYMSETFTVLSETEICTHGEMPEPVKEYETLSTDPIMPYRSRKQQEDCTSVASAYLDECVAKKTRELERLTNKCEDKQDLLHGWIAKTSYFDPRNVRKREKTSKKTISQYKEQVCELKSKLEKCQKNLEEKQTELENLEMQFQNQLNELEKKLNKQEEQKKKAQKMKSYYKSKQSDTLGDGVDENEDSSVKERELHEHIAQLENSVCELEDDLETLPCITKDLSGEFSQEVRQCVLELLGLENALHKVTPVIQSVSRNIFNTVLNDKDLPSRQTVSKISDEGQFLIKTFYAEKMLDASHWGINKDGTTRKKIKLLDTAVTLNTGEVLPLGFRRVARETGEGIADNTKLELQEIQTVYNQGNPEVQFVDKTLETLSFIMNDRAANEKLANKMLCEWRTQRLTECQSPAQETIVHHFHCSAHVLLGWHRDVDKNLRALQKATEEKDGSRFGRESIPYFQMRFGAADATAGRVTRMTSELLGPNVDEKSGIRDKWLLWCEHASTKSIIGDYRDNRFNAVFKTGAEIIHHLPLILQLLDHLKQKKPKPNLKIQSVHADLTDPRVITFLHALALFYVQVTLPYWEMVNGNTHYLQLYQVIQPLHSALALWEDDPAPLLTGGEPVVTQLPVNTTDRLYCSVMGYVQPPEQKELLYAALKCMSGGLRDTLERQMTEFLIGQYSIPATDTELERTAGSHLHNLACEHHFGDLDASQKRRPNASIHYHSSVQLLKRNRLSLSEWLRGKSEDEARQLWALAKKSGSMLRKQHKQDEKDQKDLEKNHIMAAEPPKKKKKKDTTKEKPQKRKKAAAEAELVTTPPRPIAIHAIVKDDWIAVAYSNGWYPGCVTEVRGDGTFVADFLHPGSTPGRYKNPAKPDIAPVGGDYIFSQDFDPPISRSGGRFYQLLQHQELEQDYTVFMDANVHLFE